MRTSELTGFALDWAVAQCEYVDVRYGFDDNCPEYSVDWVKSGPIIERECICVECSFAENAWSAWTPAPERELGEAYGNGLTPLIAAMRCYVASKLGDDVSLPPDMV